MMRRCWMFGLAVVLLIGFSSPAYPWGYATHAYIAHLLNKKVGQRDLNETYAAMAPDLFNLHFDLPVMGPGELYYWLHYRYDCVWDQKERGQSKGLGYGFISHNDEWGADFTAHHAGRTYGEEEGYVVKKAMDLGNEVPPAPFPPLSSFLPPEVALELQHTLVEYSLDILTKRLDPMIGQRIAASAANRSPEFPGLLVAAYASEPEFAALFGGDDPAEAIFEAEAEFQAMMYQYGMALTFEEDMARQLISGQLAIVAQAYLAANGISLPPELPPEYLPFYIEAYLDLAMGICELDFPAEISATIDYVDEEMADRKIGNQQ